MSSNLTVKKVLRGYSCAHRQWNADSHCKFVHGYDRTFMLGISADTLDKQGWVFDFGGFGPVKKLLADQFDHTLCIAYDDPQRSAFETLHQAGAVDLRIMDSPIIEGGVLWVREHVGALIAELTLGRCWLSEVECHENEKNSVHWSLG